MNTKTSNSDNNSLRIEGNFEWIENDLRLVDSNEEKIKLLELELEEIKAEESFIKKNLKSLRSNLNKVSEKILSESKRFIK